MKATVYHGARDVRLETVADPVLREPTDAIVRVTRAAICGSDLWFYRGVTQWEPGDRTGHEFVGIVEETGSAVRTLARGDLVIAPFVSSDGTCEFCLEGLPTSCVHMTNWGDDANGGQAEAVRVPYADGTLVKALPGLDADPRKLASALTLTDVMATGHHGVVSAHAARGGTVVIVGDGAVGLCGVLSAAKVVGAERVIAVGHNAKRLELAREFGATHTSTPTMTASPQRFSNSPAAAPRRSSKRSAIRKAWISRSKSRVRAVPSPSLACRTTCWRRRCARSS